MNQASQHSRGWRASPAPSWTSLQHHWLLRPGALTAGLRQLGHVELRVLAEYPAGLAPDEAPGLSRAPRSAVWVREVAMAVDGIDSVVARSVTPLAASHATWQGVRRLRTRPLADMLYHDRSIARSPFQVARLTPAQAIHGVALPLAGADAHEPGDLPRLLARRSVFWRHGQPLMVAECFLPAFWELALPR
ncbi:Chorismate--pyruvate lyase [plant metagenome]|uniref:Chorismate--pyruvate lyase n=1 Tax=plant metagenome TaxID=1297885 RepID=A0A484V277_9ZZZZ